MSLFLFFFPGLSLGELQVPALYSQTGLAYPSLPSAALSAGIPCAAWDNLQCCQFLGTGVNWEPQGVLAATATLHPY